MGDITKLIKYHDFPEEGTLSNTRLKMVKLSVQEGSDKTKGCGRKHVCGNCERTINCWVEEAENRERKMTKKQNLSEAEVKSEEKASAPPQHELTNTPYVCVFPCKPPEYTLPGAGLQGLKWDPDLDCSPFPPHRQVPVVRPVPTPRRRQERNSAAEQQAEETRTAGEEGARAAEPAEEARAPELSEREERALEVFRETETPPPVRRKKPAIRRLKSKNRGLQPYVLRSTTRARGAEGVPDSDSEDEDNEALDDGEAQTRKRKSWQREVKEERVSLTMPMFEMVNAEGGLSLIYRPWCLSDMKEAMAHLPSPEDAGDRFATELTVFCREFSPTLNELKRLLMVKLGGMNWHKVSAELPVGDRRRVHAEWGHATNDAYRAAVTELANTVRRVFPACIDMSRISHCRQEPGESVQTYYEHLFAAFNKHSGLTEPADRGDRPGIWESY
ncbi:MAG: hypothetical protein ACRDC4_12525, partial [Plesiomonas sp.]